MCWCIVTRKMAIDCRIRRFVVLSYLLVGSASAPAEAISVKILKAFPFLQNLYPSLWAIGRSHAPYWRVLGHHSVVRADGEYKRCGLEQRLGETQFGM